MGLGILADKVHVPTTAVLVARLFGASLIFGVRFAAARAIVASQHLT
jgi:hypothetical protein